jgi:hypothetical protein
VRLISLVMIITLFNSCATDFHRTPYMGRSKKLIYCVKDFVSIGIGPIEADTICHNAYKKCKEGK